MQQDATTVDEQPKRAPRKNSADATEYSADEAPKKPKRSRKNPSPSGVTGNRVIYGSLVDEEKNTAVKGERAYETYDLMRRTDAECHEALEILKTPMLVCPFVIEPASDEEIDREIADFVASNLFEDLPWNRIHEETLLRFDFGASIFEQLTDVRMLERQRFPNLPTVRGAGRPARGEMVPALRWTGFEFRHPRTVRRWIVSKASTVRLEALVQWSEGDDTHTAGEVEIPIANLLRFTHRQEGGNFAGRSKLRPMYADHRESNHLRKVEAVRHERQNCGIPVFKEPEYPDQDDIDSLAETAEALSAYQQSYLMIPHGWEFAFDTSGEGNGTNVAERLEKLRRGKLGSVLGGFMALGENGVGSNALLRGQSERQIDYVEVEIRNTQDGWNIGADGWSPVRALVDANYGARRLELGSRGYPKLRAKNTRRGQYIALVNAITALGQAGFISERNKRVIEKFLLQALEIDGASYVSGDEGDDRRGAHTEDEKPAEEAAQPEPAEKSEQADPPADPAPEPEQKPAARRRGAKK